MQIRESSVSAQIKEKSASNLPRISVKSPLVVKERKCSTSTPKNRSLLLKTQSIEEKLLTENQPANLLVNLNANIVDGQKADCIILARMTVDGLYSDRLTRLVDFDVLKKAVRELVSDGMTEDRGTLRDLLADLQECWNKLMDKIIAVFSSLVRLYTFHYFCADILYNNN